MRKPAFAYFYDLCILISFSLLTITVRGYQISIAYCLFSFKLVSDRWAKPICGHHLGRRVGNNSANVRRL